MATRRSRAGALAWVLTSWTVGEWQARRGRRLVSWRRVVMTVRGVVGTAGVRIGGRASLLEGGNRRARFVGVGSGGAYRASGSRASQASVAPFGLLPGTTTGRPSAEMP